MGPTRNLGARSTILLCALAACASSEGTPRESVDALASIRAAQELRSDEEPEAAFYLALAREQAAKAEQREREGEHDAAQLLLLRAKADADLAIAISQEAHARSEAQQIHDRVNSQLDAL